MSNPTPPFTPEVVAAVTAAHEHRPPGGQPPHRPLAGRRARR
ncbi:MAG: hypothetical protein V9E94_04865 [Microthrixaceae bacterium]